jgi:hypothetical protein
MPSALDQHCITILYAVASSGFGLVIYTDDPVKARYTLYRVRKEVGDVVLANIQIRVSPNDSEHELWLLRMDTANAVMLSLKPVLADESLI